ncbi:ABC transporter permease [Streptomyces sp. NPDC005408]|uniref:ABC transporter permease n=1 Tax=Streptomyces sp. NPDC005408 TaxID=3155341 RepID=UPI0033B233C8
MNTTVVAVTGRLKALGRAELTLLVRNRSALAVALFVPVAMIGAIKASLDPLDPEEAGMSVPEAAMTGGIGMTLIMVVYTNLVSAYTARREALVLKRLRTGEASDPEILTGIALPAAVLALAQCAVMVVAGVVLLRLKVPVRPELLVAGVLVGMVLLSALAAATSAYTRTVESAQITTLPVFLVSMIGSGLFIPLEVLPQKMASLCELLPMTGVVQLVRAGWLGGAQTYDLLGAALNALAWTVLAVFAVVRWFRWEPRR